MAFSPTYDTTNTGAAVSNREDLTNILTQLAPTETPLLSLAPKSKARATYHEWTVDSLADPTTAGVFEGVDITAFSDKFENRARLGNHTQGYQRAWQVSQVQAKVDSVGPAADAAARIKCMREIKRDIEATLVSNNNAVVGTAAAKYKMRGLGDWLDSSDPGSPIAVPSSYRTPAAQIATSCTEVILEAMLGSMFRVSGDNSSVTMIADTAIRNNMADFTRGGASQDVHRYSVSGTGKKVTLAVDVFESDFGLIKVTNSNPACSFDTTNNDRAFLVNFAHIGVAELLPFSNFDLEDSGGGSRGYSEWWGTLECNDPRAHGKIN
tara:strand:- start:866 stop:1834 length:969 start_codon:yes stop_codon:yes gene_type:complete